MQGQLDTMTKILHDLAVNSTPNQWVNALKAAAPKTQTVNSASKSEKPLIQASRIEPPPKPEWGRFGSRFFMTSDRMISAKAQISCKGKIKHGTAQILGAAITANNSGLVDEHTFDAIISVPNWGPGAPLIVDLYSDEELGACNITQLL
jgi:hypothetical protein